MKLWLLVALLAGAVLGILSITDVLRTGELWDIALKTFGVLAVLFVVHVAWRAVRGRTGVPDRTDQHVP
jgi:hypothetical protein